MTGVGTSASWTQPPGVRDQARVLMVDFFGLITANVRHVYREESVCSALSHSLEHLPSASTNAI